MISNSIRNCKLFQGVEEEHIIKVIETANMIDVEIGQTISRNRIVEKNIFIVAEGAARLLAEDENHELTTIGSAVGFEPIGVVDILRQSATECAVARTNSKLVAIDSEIIVELARTSKAFLENTNNYHNICEEVEIEKEIRMRSSSDKGFILKEIIEDLKNDNKIMKNVLSTKLKGYEALVGKEVDTKKIEELQNKTIIPIRIVAKKMITNEKMLNRIDNVENKNKFTWDKEGLDLENYGVREVSNEYLKRKSLIRVDKEEGQHLAILKIIANELECPCPVDIYEEIIQENLARLGNIPIQGIGQMLEIMGLQTQLVQIKKSALGRIERPSIINIKNKNWLVLNTLDKETVYNPFNGKKRLEINPEKDEEVTTLLIKRTDMTSTKIFGLSWFIPALKKYKWQLTQVLVASLFIQIFQLANPLLIQQIIDKVISQSNLSALQVLGAALVVSALLQGLLTAIRTWLLIDTTDRMDLMLGSQVIDRLLRLRLRFFEQRPVGELSQRLGELANIRNFLTGTAITSALDLLFAAVYIFIMYYYSPLLATVALSTIPIYITMILLVAPLYRRLIRKQAKFNAQTQSHLIETLNGIQTIKAQNVELNSRWKWQQRYSSQINEGFKSVIVGTSAGEVGNFLNQLSSLLIIWVGVTLVLKGDLSLGQLIAFRIIAGYVTGPILRLSSLWQGYQQVSVSMERLADIVDQTPEESMEERNKISLPIIKGEIEFKGVSFKFNSKTENVIDDVDLKIKAGEFVGIVGRSGSGKSTLVKLLPRLYSLDEGKILIDNYDIDKVTIQSIRKQIGIVPQDCLLFEGTIKDNISLNNPDASEEEIIEAATLSDAHNFIMELPDGYATRLGERGAGLSGGQRQRIAIARTLLQNPEMLILDEATSALDYETESRVCNNLQKKLKGKTVLFITHRLNTIKDSDKIVLMHNGKVMEEGTHKELLSVGMRYKTLYDSQGFND